MTTLIFKYPDLRFSHHWLIVAAVSLLLHGAVLWVKNQNFGTPEKTTQTAYHLAISVLQSAPKATQEISAPEIQEVQEQKVTPKPIVKRKTVKQIAKPVPIKRKAQKASKPAVAKQVVSNTVAKVATTASAGEIANYKSQIISHFKQFERKAYPKRAASKRLNGSVLVTFTVTADGSLASSRIKTGSKHRILDKAAIKLLKMAAPYPKAPSNYNKPSITITAPIDFQVN